MQKCVHCVISGKVQGVYYRATTKEVADKYSLKGYVKNLANGDVEAAVEGDENDIEQMIEWLHQGPTRAIVDRVVVKPVLCSNYSDFEVRY